MRGWMYRLVGGREMEGGVCTVVLPKVMVGLFNMQYVVIFSRETGISVMLKIIRGKGMEKFHGMIVLGEYCT